MAIPKRLEYTAEMEKRMLRHFQAGRLAREEGRKAALVTSGELEIGGIACILIDGDMADERDFDDGG